jgi:hypothetical protein
MKSITTFIKKFDEMLYITILVFTITVVCFVVVVIFRNLSLKEESQQEDRNGQKYIIELKE